MHDVAIDQHALYPAGPQAARIGASWDFNLLIMTGVCALVVLVVLWAVLRKRHALALPVPEPALERDFLPLPEAERARSVRELDARTEVSRRRGVVISTLLTLLALIALMVESVLAGNALDALPTRDALHIEIVGRQWWWAIRYPAQQLTESFSTANELHIPVGVAVVLQLSAADVIHSFWAPNLHGKRDLIPGRPSELRFRADKLGSYRAQCAEFCGLAHAEMSLPIEVQTREAFEAWRAHQRAAATPPTEPRAARGQQVFLTSSCPACHTLSGTPARGDNGPDLSHVGARMTLAAGTLSNTRAHLERWLADPQLIKPGNRMPRPPLAADDLRDLAAYLEALQ